MMVTGRGEAKSAIRSGSGRSARRSINDWVNSVTRSSESADDPRGEAMRDEPR